MAPNCLIVQPIHPLGITQLERAGIQVRHVSHSDMATVAREITTADAVITRNAGLDRSAMEQAHRLKVIGNHGTGLDPVDVDCATELGIPVVYTPYANAESVAELTVSLMLALAKQLRSADQATRSGDFTFKYHSGIQELSKKTLGIIGFGRIGRRVIEIMQAAFKMSVLVYSPSSSQEAVHALGAQKVQSLSTLLQDSDIVSLHVPLKSSTYHLIGRNELSLMKPTALLINTARGSVVDEQALIATLQKGQIAGAGLDVYASETMSKGYALLELNNVILTPHIGGSSDEALQRTALDVVKQVIDVLNGTYPQYLVNKEVWAHRRT
jgi:D-3-phosphoglycerate dehydrogenase